MTRDGMPRAYLRIDPNIDQTHPDLDAFMRLLCAAGRQPERGRFKDRALMDRAMGRAKASKALARGDVSVMKDGRLYVEGWDEWQEGDVTVGERMRRMRARRNGKRDLTVTTPLPPSIDVTTDAESLASGVGLLPPTPAKRGLRANGTNPRSLADIARTAVEDQLEQRRRAVRELKQRYYRGEITEARMETLVADLAKEPDAYTRTPEEVA